MSGWVGGFESEPLPDLRPRGRGVSDLGSSDSGVLPDESGPLPDSRFRVWVMSSHKRVSGSESLGIRTKLVLKIEEEIGRASCRERV